MPSLAFWNVKNLGFDREFRSFCGGEFTNQRHRQPKAGQLDLASGDAETATLEAEIEHATDPPPPLRDFISPREAEASARLHTAHAVGRGAALDAPPVPESPLAYLNRLSDCCSRSRVSPISKADS